MIEWTTALRTYVEVLHSGERLSGVEERVGDPEDPGIIGLGIVGEGGGVVVEGTLDELKSLARHITATIDRFGPDVANSGGCWGDEEAVS